MTTSNNDSEEIEKDLESMDIEELLDSLKNDYSHSGNPKIKKSILESEKSDASISEHNFEDDRANDFLKHMDESIVNDQESKHKFRRVIILSFSIYFCVVTLLVFFILIDPINHGYSDTIKLSLIGGFFTNLIGLLIIIFKYVFSPTKEHYDFVMNIFKRNVNGSVVINKHKEQDK